MKTDWATWAAYGIVFIILSTIFITGCTDINNKPIGPRPNQNETQFVKTDTAYMYSVDCKHSVICYWYLGSAAQVSCVYIPRLDMKISGECN